MQLLKTWEMAGEIVTNMADGRVKCNIHKCWYDETVTDMHADSMRLLKTWLLVMCNCKIHPLWSGAIVLTSP